MNQFLNYLKFLILKTGCFRFLIARKKLSNPDFLASYFEVNGLEHVEQHIVTLMYAILQYHIAFCMLYHFPAKDNIKFSHLFKKKTLF